MTLYLRDLDSHLLKRHGRFRVMKNGTAVADLPVKKVDRIVVYGPVSLTAGIIAYCLAEGIDVVFLSTHGRFQGRLQGEYRNDVRARQAQFHAAGRPAERLAIARAFVAGKLANERIVCTRREGGQDAAKTLLRAEKNVQKTADIPSLLGQEGWATKAYFKAFRSFLKDRMGFKQRIAHPPPDPINILLSLGYTLLYKDTIAALSVVGLDPYQGLYHECRAGHAALASDLMEEFRAPVIDLLVIGLINRRAITRKEFSKGWGKQNLLDSGLKTFFTAYSERMDTRVLHTPSGQQTTYARSLELQAQQLRRVLLKEANRYDPFLLRP